MDQDDFFVGWDKPPKADRRFFLGAGIGLMLSTGALAAALAAKQNQPGPGTWDQTDVREWRGVVTGQPYAMFRTADLNGKPKTALLSCLGKCGVAAQIGALEGKSVVVRGSLIQRGRHAMIAVAENEDWIWENDRVLPTADLAFPNYEAIGEVSLNGEILDSKCWFGAMRPSEGKVHKACAALCIRGGIPPAFFARDKQNKRSLLIMTDHQAGHGDDLLPLVADPVSVRGKVYKRGDILFLDNPVENIVRL